MADMFKNQLQELAQRSCFNLPSYACIREGPDHAPRFKASVNFNGEIFESPSYCTTLRQAEHAAAEVALNVLSTRGPSRSLTARVLDETGIYKNLLQETAHRAGLNLPVYTTVRSGPGHVPVFTCTVELAGMNFAGEPAKTKKQAEKNAAIAAWSALKRMPNLDSLTNKEMENREEQDQAIVARVLSNFRPKDENRRAWRRNQNQPGRRIIRGHRENASAASSSSSSNSLQYQQWRLLDLLMDSAFDGSTHKQNNFVSLLPPPPPRAASKILPPTSPSENHYPSLSHSSYLSNRPIPVQVRANSRVKMLDSTLASLEEHRRDEEEWPCAKQDPINKSIEKESSTSSNASNSATVYGAASCLYNPFPHPNASKLNTCMLDRTSQVNNRLFGSSMAAHMPKTMHTCGFNPQRMAPAVQIRSVIPVCAAPPPLRTPSSSSSNQPSMKEASPSTISASSPSAKSKSMSLQTGAPTEISSSASSDSVAFNNPTQLSSELNKLQL